MTSRRSSHSSTASPMQPNALSKTTRNDTRVESLNENNNVASDGNRIPNVYRYMFVILLTFGPTLWRSISKMVYNYSLNRKSQERTSYFKKFTSSDEEKYVTCGSAIKLSHAITGYVLNSQSDANWSGRGSGQQVVTGNPDISSQQSLWLVREGHSIAKTGNQCPAATPIKCNSTIRLTHLLTNKNLHSHSAFPSQMSRANEVTAYSPHSNGEGDVSDDWIIECGNGAKNWSRNVPVKLRHSSTSGYLSTNASNEFNQRNCGRNCPIKYHLEVFGGPDKDQSTLWIATIGVHLSS